MIRLGCWAISPAVHGLPAARSVEEDHVAELAFAARPLRSEGLGLDPLRVGHPVAELAACEVVQGAVFRVVRDHARGQRGDERARREPPDEEAVEEPDGRPGQQAGGERGPAAGQRLELRGDDAGQHEGRAG